MNVLIERGPQPVNLMLVRQYVCLDPSQHQVQVLVVLVDVVVQVLLEPVNPAVESCKVRAGFGVKQCCKLSIGFLVLHLPAEESDVVFEHLQFAGQVLHKGMDLVNRALRYHNGVGRFFVVVVRQ